MMEHTPKPVMSSEEVKAAKAKAEIANENEGLLNSFRDNPVKALRDLRLLQLKVSSVSTLSDLELLNIFNQFEFAVTSKIQSNSPHFTDPDLDVYAHGRGDFLSQERIEPLFRVFKHAGYTQEEVRRLVIFLVEYHKEDQKLQLQAQLLNLVNAIYEEKK